MSASPLKANVSVTEYCDQANLQEKRFILAYGSIGLESRMAGQIAAGRPGMAAAAGCREFTHRTL